MYVDQAKTQPLEFLVPKDSAADVWGRAQSFIGRFSDMKLQIVTDYVIQTYNPQGLTFGYSVTKAPSGGSSQFNVQCFTGNMFASDSLVERDACLQAREMPKVTRRFLNGMNY